jgi:hypothetical protein
MAERFNSYLCIAPENAVMLLHQPKLIAFFALVCHLAVAQTAPADTTDQRGQNAVVFPPSATPNTCQATQIVDNLTVDGRLNEAAWQRATPIRNFIQSDPIQGQPSRHATEVRVLFNRNYLYIAAFSRDSLGKRGLRVPNFKRDFDLDNHDLFGVAIDGFQDRRNAMAFMTNPYATQSDLLSFDDALYDTDWDGLWRVRTSRTDSGWVAEIQIPWQTLRYRRSADSTQTWGINFFRNRRASNELSAWSPYPRAFSALRMDYAGLLTGLKPPPPRPNIRVQPYILLASDAYSGSETDNSRTTKPKIGGDLKWAINPNTVLDLTANTDFAQADVDRQVNNLTRLSVLFPERRAFFLENASLFGAGLAPQNDYGDGGNMVIQPFFSRTIGLANLPDGTSTPVPIDAGARLVYRGLKRNFGGMAIRQRGTTDSPTTDFLIGRYVENIGETNRIGALVAIKNAHGLGQTPGYQNTTAAVDGFFRLNDALAYNAMVIGSSSSDGTGRGMAAYSQFFLQENQLVGWLTQSVVTKNFSPEMGFVSRSDVITNSLGGYLVKRPRWLPKQIRNFEPGIFLETYHKASTGYLQEGTFSLTPVWFTFQSGAAFGVYASTTFQRLDDGDYRPLDLPIPSGKYRYARVTSIFSNDPSQKFSWEISGETGQYYNGLLTTGNGSVSIAPIPHVAFTVRAELNDFKNVSGFTGLVQLYSAESRLALNPRLQLISFIQRNTYTDRTNYNIRLAWEFVPLSFLYVVYNHGTYAGTIDSRQRQQEQHVIGKLSYLRQF